MNPPTPFAWSWSRHRTFEACRRRYGYDYYLTRGGARTGVAPDKAWLHRLKRTQDGPQWIGLRVHAFVAAVLEGARAGDEDVDALRQRHLADAAAHLAAVRGGSPDPSRWPDVADLQGPDADGAAAALLDALRGRVGEALDHALMRRLRAVPERIREVERTHRRTVLGVRLSASPDVVVADGRGGLVIIDWKTGDPEHARASTPQLQIYARVVQEAWRAHAGQVQALIATTRDGAHQAVDVGPGAIEDALDLAQTSAAHMASLLPDPARDVAPARAFPPLPRGSAPCARCRYAPACHGPDIAQGSLASGVLPYEQPTFNVDDS